MDISLIWTSPTPLFPARRRRPLNREAFTSAALELGLQFTSEQFELFEAFEERLYEMNAVMNLTRVPREECWLRHFIDSLLFHDLVPLGATVLDVGTGPGFPAWPLACARPDLQVVALDSSGKMIGYLSKNPLPNLKPLLTRAEEWQMRDAFDLVTGRAVAPLGVQLELSAPLCKLGGLVLPMRTPAEADQIKSDVSKLGLELVDLHERPLPGTDVVRLFPLYQKVAPTPARYPRAWSEIKRKPVI